MIEVDKINELFVLKGRSINKVVIGLMVEEKDDHLKVVISS